MRFVPIYHPTKLNFGAECLTGYLTSNHSRMFDTRDIM